LSLQVNRAAHYIFVSSKSSPPRFVTDEYCLLGARQIFSWPEVATENRNDAKRAKEAIAYGRARYIFCAGSRIERQAIGSIDIERSEHAIEPLPVDIVRVGEMVSVADWNTFEKSDQSRGVAIGNGFIKAASTKAKIAALAAILSAKTETAVKVKPRFLRS
jgi:hypothetical protein